MKTVGRLGIERERRQRVLSLWVFFVWKRASRSSSAAIASDRCPQSWYVYSVASSGCELSRLGFVSLSRTSCFTVLCFYQRFFWCWQELNRHSYFQKPQPRTKRPQEILWPGVLYNLVVFCRLAVWRSTWKGSMLPATGCSISSVEPL